MSRESIEITVHFKGSFAGDAREVGMQLHERLIYPLLDQASRDWPADKREILRTTVILGLIGDAAAWLQVVAGHEATAKMLENLRDVVVQTGTEMAAELARRTH